MSLGRVAAGSARVSLGHPRVHHRITDSTNARARELAARGAPHGTLVSAAEQTAGRGRQGRSWTAPADRSLLCSVVLREPPRLLPLLAGAAVADTVLTLTGAQAQIKWPNDVLLQTRKVAGILVAGRPQERWAVLGVGLNVAVNPAELGPELAERAGTLGLGPDAIEPALVALLCSLERWLAAGEDEVLQAVRERDALRGRPVRWQDGSGTAAGIDSDGRLLVDTDAGEVTLDAGEVHLGG